MSATAEHLLANRELLSLDRARLYLGSRQRVRTPLGAAEYLEMRKEPDGLWWEPDEGDLIFESEDKPLTNDRATAYDKRLKVALDCMEIYRNAFPKEYAQSTAAPFSLQREQELYHLIHTQLFPLLRREDNHERVSADDMSRFIGSHPDFFLPYIPLRGSQHHVWHEGQFDFLEIGIEYQIAFALSWQWLMPAGVAWTVMKRGYALDGCPEPLQSSGEIAGSTVAWTLFCYSCRIEEAPLQWLPLAFQAIAYKTDNVWLDMPQIAIGLEWSLRQVFGLHMMWAQAADMMLALKALGIWLEEKPQERIARCVEIWNDAVRKEQQSGMAGMLRNEETGDWLQ